MCGLGVVRWCVSVDRIGRLNIVWAVVRGVGIHRSRRGTRSLSRIRRGISSGVLIPRWGSVVPMPAIWLLVELHGRNGLVCDSIVLLVGAAELNAVSDETDPGNELENDADREAYDSTVPNSIFLRGTVVVVTVALIDLGQVIYGTL